MGRAEKANPRSAWRRKHNPVPIPYHDVSKPNFVPKAEITLETPFINKLIDSIKNWVTRVLRG